MPAAGLTCQLHLRISRLRWEKNRSKKSLLRIKSIEAYAAMALTTAAPGFTLTCRASKATPLVITAHKMRAFLFASATADFCQPDFSLSLSTHCEIGSSRLCADITADLAAWINNMRRYMSPRLVMPPRLFLPPLEFCFGV